MFSCSCTGAQRLPTLSSSVVRRCHAPGRTRITTQAFIPLPGWARRPAHISAHHKAKSKHPVTQEDINRQRQRFGDRPARRRPQKGDDKPSLLEELQHLRSSGEAAAFLADKWRRLVVRTDNFLGRKLYDYFNWRQDTSKDLVVTFGVFSTLVLAASMLRRWGVDNPSDRAGGNLWADIYQVCQWVFGQEFPGPDAPLGQQVMSVGTAMVGLAAFAMVLALVEQVVLETLELNVKRGSKVFESKHYLVLGWCVSQRDVEVVRKIVEQLCVAWKPQGGTTIVVLTQRSKLEMEAMFWRCLPDSKRYGTKLVFRQGSPLVPSDLRLVGANRAAATIVVSDQSRSAAEADAQSVRCAILLDELEDDLDDELGLQPTDSDSQKKVEDLQRDGHVVVELKTANALPLLKYACSSRVMALATTQLNAQRLAKMVKRPVISIISQQLFNFQNGVSLYGHYYKHLCGTRFGDLAYLFPDGIVLGVVDMATGKAWMAPSKDFVVQEKHSLVICRPTEIGDYRPLDAPPPESELKLQEALTGWVGPTGKSLHDSEWLLQHTPVTTFDTALAAEQRSNHSAAGAPTPTPTDTPSGSSSSGGGSSNSLLLPGNPEWSSSISQVELLRQQVEAAACRYSDGQPSILHGGECGAPGPSTQPAGSSSTSNNIVPVPQLGSVQVATVREALQPSFAAAAAAGQQLSSSTGGTLPALVGTTAGARLPGPATANSSSMGGNAVMVAAQQGVLGLAASYVHPFCMEPAGSLVLSDGSKGAPAGSSGAHGSSSSGSSSSSSSTNGDYGAALRTTDWPVLSGAPERSAKSLWLPCKAKQHPAQRKRQASQRMAKSSVVGRFTAGGTGTGVQPKLLPVSYRTGQQQGVLNDAAVLVPPEYYAVDDKPVSVCVLGWGPNSLMASLIKELDHGLSALPKGSEVTFVNMHSPHDSLGQALQNITLENVQVRHVAANPLQRSSLAAALDFRTFRCAVVLCDELWVDPDNNDSNGLDSLDEPSVLRLDSLVMVAQLNMRKLLEDSRMPAINIICQKVASEGLTRFEDRHRLPFGVSVNLNSFAAKVLAQIAANPAMLVPVTRLGEDAMLTIADSADYAALGEELNFWQLMARFQVTGDVLLGYYEIPETVDIPLNTVINPFGEERNVPRVWNKGDRNLQFILLCHKQHRHGSTSGSHDDMELESTKQAHWVTARERSPHASGSSSSLHSSSHPNSFTDAH